MDATVDQAVWLKHYEPGMPDHLDYSGKTIDDLLARIARPSIRGASRPITS